jgi:hypothetical protein
VRIVLSGNAPIEVFPFVDALHREVIIRHEDNTSEDIEMTLDEAERVAQTILQAVAVARTTVVPIDDVNAVAELIDAATKDI